MVALALHVAARVYMYNLLGLIKHTFDCGHNDGYAVWSYVTACISHCVQLQGLSGTVVAKEIRPTCRKQRQGSSYTQTAALGWVADDVMEWKCGSTF